MKTIKKKLSEGHKENIKKGMLKFFDNKGRKGTICKNGYRIITIHGKRVYEHRLIWEKYNGKIPEGYHIHHINGNKLDNRIENLELINLSEHERLHAKEKKLGSRKGIEPINKTSKEIRNQILNLRKQGKLLNEICNIVNLSYPTVQKYAKGVA